MNARSYEELKSGLGERPEATRAGHDKSGVLAAPSKSPCTAVDKGTPQTSVQKDSDAELGMAWWNHITEAERAQWLRHANSAVPADAWAAFKAHRPDEVAR